MSNHFLYTRVQAKRTEIERTVFLLETSDGKFRAIEYGVPFELPTMGVGGRINFYCGSITDSLKGRSINHSNYDSAAFYREGESSPLLKISGERLALFEKAIRERRKCRGERR